MWFLRNPFRFLLMFFVTYVVVTSYIFEYVIVQNWSQFDSLIFFLYFKKQLWICMKLVRYLSSLSSESFELKKNATSFCSKLDIFMLWFDPYGHCYLAKLSNTISTLPTQQILYLSLWYGVLNYVLEFLNHQSGVLTL